MLGIYCRTSRKESVSGVETIEQQKEAGVKFAESNNLPYIIYDKDSGKSGYIEKSKEDPFSNRPDFKRLLSDIDSGKITEIWVWELSRLARRNKYYADVIDRLAEKKIIIHVQNKKIDLANDYERAMAEMQGVWADLERNEIVARTSRGKKAATNKGHLRHRELFGYKTYCIKDNNTKITEPIPEELETVKQIFNDYLRGYNLREIGRKYFISSSPETVELLGTVKKVKRILSHEEYTGQNLKTDGREIEKDFENEKRNDIQELSKDDYWVNNNFYKEKIIDRETWIKAREKIEWTRRSLKHTQGKNKRETNRSLASGLLKCISCGCNYYFKDLGKKHGGAVYQHLRTVEKCPQKPSQMIIKKLDTILDVFYTFFYLLFDNTEFRLKQMKLSVKQDIKILNAQLKELYKNKSAIQKRIDNFYKCIEDDDFNDDKEAVKIAVKMAAKDETQLEKINTNINLKNLEIEDTKKQESEIARNERFKVNTLERIQNWFELREKNSYSELKTLLNESLLGGNITIADNEIIITVNNSSIENYLPDFTYHFDLTNDYNIIYPFIENIINKKLNKTYTPIEEVWIKNRKDLIENFGEYVKKFLESRPNEADQDFTEISPDFDHQQYIILSHCFNSEKLIGEYDELSQMYGKDKELDSFLDMTEDFYSLYLLTDKEENLLQEKYHTTKEVAEMLNKPASSLREWARKHGIKTHYSAGVKTLLWTDKDIENYKNRPKHASGFRHSEETKKHWSEIRKGRKPSEESLKKRSETMKKVWAEKKAKTEKN